MVSYSRHRLTLMRQQLYASAGPCPELFSSLREHGLDQGTVQAHCGVYAVVLARFEETASGDRVFDFDCDGVPAVVIEALLYDLNREQFVGDLVAWPLQAPEYFAMALGAAAGADILGVEHMVQRGGRPLRVFRMPLEWLQAGCIGCVPLTEAGGRNWLNRAGGPFVVGSVEEGRWLRNYLGAFASRHRILVPTRGRRAA